MPGDRYTQSSHPPPACRLRAAEACQFGLLESSFVAVRAGEGWQFFSPSEMYTSFGMLGWPEEGQEGAHYKTQQDQQGSRKPGGDFHKMKTFRKVVSWGRVAKPKRLKTSRWRGLSATSPRKKQLDCNSAFQSWQS